MTVTSESRPPPERRRMVRVLLVDTSIDDAFRLAGALAGQDDLRLHTARDIDDARSTVKEGATDVVLVDGDLWLDESPEGLRGLAADHPDLAFVVLTTPGNERE